MSDPVSAGISLGISLGTQLLVGLLAPNRTIKAPDTSFNLSKSEWGADLPKIFGRVRISGNHFLLPYDLSYRVEKTSKTQGNKGLGGSTTTEGTNTYGSFAVAFNAYSTDIAKLIVQGKQIGLTDKFYTDYCEWFDGTQTAIWNKITGDDAPYDQIQYRNISYLGVTDLPLRNYGDQIPSQIDAIVVDKEHGNNPTLDLVVGTIMGMAGYSPIDYDVTELNDIILKTGFKMHQSGESYRNTLEQLMNFYLFAPIEKKDGIIKFKKFDRGEDITLTIDKRLMFPVDDGFSFSRVISDKKTFPTKLEISYQDQNKGYQNNKIVVYEGEESNNNFVTTTLDLNLTSQSTEVTRRATLVLAHLNNKKRVPYNFEYPLSFIDQIEGLDVVEMPNGERCQIFSIQKSALDKLEIIGSYYDSTDFAFDDSTLEDDNPPALIVPPIPNIFILETPLLFEEDLPGTLYVAADQICTINYSLDNGATYNKATDHINISTIANINNTLPSATGLDVTNTLDATLFSGADLTDITQPQFDVGQNLCLIGRQTGSGYWEGELLKFRDVIDNGSGNFTLSHLERGLYGTSTTHVSGEKLFLITGDGAYISKIAGSSSLIGQTITFIPINSAFQDIGSTPLTNIIPSGISYKPPAPTNLISKIDRDGNIKYNWDYNNAYSPYSNGAENIYFEIDIYDGVSVIRTLTITDKMVVYQFTDRTIDGIGSTIKLRLYAVSSIVGRGFPLIDDANIPTLEPNVIFGSNNGLTFNQTIFLDDTDAGYPDFTVLEEWNGSLIICTISTAIYLNLTFPATLSAGFNVYVENDINSDIGGRVKIIADFLATPDDKKDILRGSSSLVAKINNNHFLFGNDRKYLQVDDANTPVRKIWDFIAGTGVTLDLEDDEPNDKSKITINSSGGSKNLEVDDILQPNQPTWNLISGDNVSIVPVEDVINAEIDITIDATQKALRIDGTNQPVRSWWNFISGVGIKLSVVDDAGGDQVMITVTQETLNVTYALPYTLQDSDNKKLVILTGSGNLTIPSGLTSNFECAFQKESNTGDITFVGSGGVVIRSKGTNLVFQYAGASLKQRSNTDIYSLFGELS